MFFWDWDELKGVPGVTAGHHVFRKTVRAFVEKEILPNIDEWEEKGDFPPELHEKAYAAGVYGAAYPVEYGGTGPEP